MLCFTFTHKQLENNFWRLSLTTESKSMPLLVCLPTLYFLYGDPWEHVWNKPQKIYTVLETASTMGGEGRVNETVFSVLHRCLPLIEFLWKNIKKKCLDDVICCPRQIVFFYTQNPAKRACSFVIPGKTFIPLWCNFGTVKFPNSAFAVTVSLDPHCCWSQFLTQ